MVMLIAHPAELAERTLGSFRKYRTVANGGLRVR